MLCHGRTLLGNNTQLHTTNVTTTPAEIAWEVLNHSPYSLDLSTFDLRLFGSLKEHMNGIVYK